VVGSIPIRLRHIKGLKELAGRHKARRRTYT
jgi:hypothetical protein